MGVISRKEKRKLVDHVVSWFEIPALDLARSVLFYNGIFDVQMEVIESQDYSMAVFPCESGIGGAIVSGHGSIPSETGSLVYLNASPDLQIVLDKVESAGGRVVLKKTLINQESGYFALFIDSEGNKLALHSMS